MKKLFKFLIPIFTLIAFVVLTPSAEAQVANCTYPSGTIVSGYTKAQCDSANGTWAGVVSNPPPASNTTSGWKGLVPCNNTPVEGKIPDKELCGFKALMTLINNIINFILFRLAVPIAAIMCAYAGILMLTAGGESAGNRTKAKGVFTNALLGLVIAAGAWLIVKTLLTILGYDGSWIGL